MERKLPLFIITGASGVGKTTVIQELRGQLPDMDIFDLDSIHTFVGSDWSNVRNIWLRIARNIAESGRVSIICGTMMPSDVEECEDYHFFKSINYLNLHCNDETRESRLRARNWSEDMIGEHKSFAKWLLENANTAYDPPMPTVDTSHTEVYQVAQQISEWVREQLKN